MSGKKYDAGKTPWDLVQLSAVEQIAEVLAYGARKYGPNNWQALDDFDSRYFAALLRHLTAWRRGEERDPESGLRHLAHAGCCLMFLLSREIGFDPSLREPVAPARPPAKPWRPWTFGDDTVPSIPVHIVDDEALPATSRSPAAPTSSERIYGARHSPESDDTSGAW